MSSTYRVLCLSHDPAITVDHWFDGFSDAMCAIEDRTDGPLQGHVDCDLVIGRFSYPLVEVGCPGGKSDGHGGSYHATFLREDASWLRLLREALAGDAAASAFAVAEAICARGCWTWQRLNRLRFELGAA